MFVFLFFSLVFNPLFAECIGDKNEKNKMIYFHGMDYKTPGKLELKNRAVLKKFAEENNFNIAIPRAQTVFKFLKENEVKATRIEFNGAHELNQNGLSQALNALNL